MRRKSKRTSPGGVGTPLVPRLRIGEIGIGHLLRLSEGCPVIFAHRLRSLTYPRALMDRYGIHGIPERLLCYVCTPLAATQASILHGQTRNGQAQHIMGIIPRRISPVTDVACRSGGCCGRSISTGGNRRVPSLGPSSLLDPSHHSYTL